MAAASMLNVVTKFTAVDKFSSVMGKMGKKTATMQEKLNKLANTSIAVGGTIMGASAGALKTFVRLEDEFANLQKVYKAADPNNFTQEFRELTNQIMDFSTATRTTQSDLIRTAIELSKTGIEGEELFETLKAFDTINLALGDNFTGGAEAAAEAVTRMTYLYGEFEGISKDIATLTVGNVLNELVQQMPVVKAEPVVEFMDRVGGMNDLVKPDMTTAAAVGATLTGLGMNPEAAASGFERAIRTISGNGQKYAKALGISVKELDRQLETDSAQVLIDYAKTLEGLSATEFQSELKKMGLNLIYSTQALNKLGGSSGVKFFEEASELAKRAREDLRGIHKEAGIVNTTTAAELSKLKSGLIAVAYEAGGALAPALNEVIQELMPIVKSVGEWVRQNPNLVVGLASIASILLTIGAAVKAYYIVMGIATGVQAAYTAAMSAYSAAAVTAALTGSSFAAVIWATLAPILLVIAAIAAIIAIFYYWDEICAWFSKVWEKFTNWISEKWDSLTEWFKNFDFVDFFKRIGNSIIDFLLFPLRTVLGVLAKIPGKIGNMAKNALEFSNTVRFNTNADRVSGGSNKKLERLNNPVYSQSNSTAQSENSQRQFAELWINDPGSNVSKVSSPIMPVHINSTKKTKR